MNSEIRAFSFLFTALWAGLASAADPAPVFSGGADLRLRQEMFDNAVWLDSGNDDHARSFQRYRARAWGQAAPTENFKAYGRLMWEGRHYSTLDLPAAIPHDDTYNGALMFDSLYLQADRLGGLPLSLKLGRQDIILGNGWLVLDGTPFDGSRTIYFDALRATYSRGDSSLDRMHHELWNDAAGGFRPVSAPDFLPETQLREVQLRRLKAVVARAYEKVPLFRQRLEKRGLTPESMQTLADIARLPFTVKTDLRDTYPFGLFASPMADVVRLHASSGTTGKPIVVAYTREDVEVWAEVMTRTFAACGLHRGDIVQNAFGYGLFTGGLGAHYGAETLGATVIPISGGNTDRQIMVLRDFGVTAICATPSYFMHLAEKAREMGVELKAMPLRVGVFGAEPWSDAMRARIEADTGIQAFDIYGLSEIIGPGVASECSQHDGLHVFEDHFYPEIIDPETGEPLPDGEEGELVLTTLSKMAMPMIRYRTRDITALLPERCGCGRSIRRIRRIGRRSDDMFIIRGVNVFPSQIEEALLRVEGTTPHYMIEVERPGTLDQLTVKVEVLPELLSDRMDRMQRLKDRIGKEILTVAGIRANVELAAPRTLERFTGKAKRVVDKRGQA